MTGSGKRLLKVLSGVIAAGAMVAGSAARAEDARLERLSPPNRALAERMLASVARWDRLYRERTIALNGGESSPETLHRETDFSIYDVRVTRGPVIEKLGSSSRYGYRYGDVALWEPLAHVQYHLDSIAAGIGLLNGDARANWEATARSLARGASPEA